MLLVLCTCVCETACWRMIIRATLVSGTHTVWCQRACCSSVGVKRHS
jgi:hypothetical protein